ncbi:MULTISPECIES: endonuclease domain-containing protein [unclassified Enterobacter]|jgi:very-short-patch-repair endonuclease|uniref:endonuclease domain-containing protein n=1 Tax=unclassified Enterobacter TaxID=2608935 RepID=UPI0015CEC4C8|nr:MULTISPECIES: endonuclease domain-containing protein [unclassified Enterobacter]MBB3304219.1 very-short-patch-repair endonuclease [Enterobacter sp. Sphag1F]NYI12677.1 very-short-patch-repair endonuclease [Enterobacter sp. Sphag71]
MMKAISRQRQLRQAMPEAELRLWCFLRNRNLCGVKFRRQHPIGRYIVDFACIERLLIVELDGGQHNEDEAKIYDQQRTDYLKRYGWRVIRFWNHQVFEEFDAVMEEIYRQLMLSGPSP